MATPCFCGWGVEFERTALIQCIQSSFWPGLSNPVFLEAVFTGVKSMRVRHTGDHMCVSDFDQVLLSLALLLCFAGAHPSFPKKWCMRGKVNFFRIFFLEFSCLKLSFFYPHIK